MADGGHDAAVFVDGAGYFLQVGIIGKVPEDAMPAGVVNDGVVIGIDPGSCQGVSQAIHEGVVGIVLPIQFGHEVLFQAVRVDRGIAALGAHIINLPASLLHDISEVDCLAEPEPGWSLDGFVFRCVGNDYCYFLHFLIAVLLILWIRCMFCCNQNIADMYDSSTENKKALESLRFQGFHVHYGGDKEDRTPDLLHAMQALSQLSYAPVNLIVRLL